jgi:hypothetical protein
VVFRAENIFNRMLIFSLLLFCFPCASNCNLIPVAALMVGPTMLKLLCNGGTDGSELMEADKSENDRSQQAISSVLQDLSECLTCDATTSLVCSLVLW